MKNITYTIGGKIVTERELDDRLSHVAYISDYRLEQLSRTSYRIMVLPEADKNTAGLKGAVLDALVDIYGNKGHFEIDIIREDDALLPKLNNTSGRTRNYC